MLHTTVQKTTVWKNNITVTICQQQQFLRCTEQVIGQIINLSHMLGDLDSRRVYDKIAFSVVGTTDFSLKYTENKKNF